MLHMFCLQNFNIVIASSFPAYLLHARAFESGSERVTKIVIFTDYPIVFLYYVIRCEPPILSVVSRYIFTAKNLRLLYRLSPSPIMHK